MALLVGWNHSDFIALFGVFASIGVGVVIVVATFRGPIIATSEADRRRVLADRRNDKMRVFRDIMGHRYDVTHPNYVAALNLIQIEFADSASVMSALSDYLVAFHPDTSAKSDCKEMRRKATVRLLTSVGNDLGYELDQLDLMEQVYSPQGWADVAEQQRLVRQLFADIASGKKGLPIFTMVPPALVEDIGDGKFGIVTVPKQSPQKPKR